MQYFDDTGRPLKLSRKLGTGGEGSVYEIHGQPDFVAKIYHDPVASEKAAKLALMVKYAPPKIASYAAWPAATLRELPSGPLRGLVLPRIDKACEIHELYSPAHRKTKFPKADWRFLIRVARNTASAFDQLHSAGIVIGDVNQGNIFVTSQALVRLIDCDSFQFSAQGQLFRCPVGVAHFVPPELQSARLPEVTRDSNHDNFGLAVLIFHLLFMGRHPFSGRYLGKGEMPIEKAIREYRFAYSNQAARFQMAPPPNSLTLGQLPAPIAKLFEQAFLPGSQQPKARPPAAKWAQAMEHLEKHVRICRFDRGHAYPQGLADCPWCQIVGEGGPNFFVSVTLQTVVPHTSKFDLDGAWRRIESVIRPGEIPPPQFVPPTRPIVPRPINIEPQKQTFRTFLKVAVILSAAVIPLGFFDILFALCGLLLMVIYGGLWMYQINKSPLNRERRARQRSLDGAWAEYRQLLSTRYEVEEKATTNFNATLDQLRQAKTRYEELDSHKQAEVSKLHHEMRQRQMDDYLETFFISSARIPGIGPTRIAALESFGIETAADVVDWRIIQVDGFGRELTQRLLAWREEKERQFRYDPSRGVPKPMLDQLDLRYAQLRNQLERQLQDGPTRLSRISGAATTEIHKFDKALTQMTQEIQQRRADMNSFDTIPWWA